MLIIGEDIEFVVSKKKQLKLKTVMLTLNVKLRFILVFLCQNVMFTFMSCVSLC